jgi:hypothetical protein
VEQNRPLRTDSPGHRRGPISGLPRIVLLVLTAWALAMVLPSFYQVAWPLASFGFSADNNGVIVDVTSPFAAVGSSPAARAGLSVGDRIDLARMTCRTPASRVCADLVTVLGGSGGLQYVLPGREIDLPVRPAQGGAPRTVHLQAALAPLSYPGRIALLANTIASILFVLAAFRLVWSRPGAMVWGFFLYAIWFNPGQTYAYYAVLQSWPIALLLEQLAEGLAVGAAYAGLLVFALRFPGGAPDRRWYGWERAVPWIGAALAALTLLGGANLFGLPTETAAAAAYLAGYGVNALVLALLLARRRHLHPRDEQRMRWVIAGCAIGLPSFIFASICEATGLLQNIWGSVPSQTVVELLFLVQGVLGYFVWTAVRRQRVINVAIPLRHGTITAALTLALAVPVVFLHERLADYQEALHLPEWIWPLVVAPIMLVVLQRLHEIAVDLIDHAFNRAYHQARQRLARAGGAMQEANSFATIDRLLTEEPVRGLRLSSAAVFRNTESVLRRMEPAIGWGEAVLRELQPGLDAPVLECLARGEPVRLPPGRWQRPGLPPEDQAPCLAVPVCGGAREGIAVALYGPHETGSDITPDECDMLRELAAYAGRGYDRVETEALRGEVRALRAQLAMLLPAAGQ